MRFDLKPSEQPNWWVLTDTENMIVMRFKEHDFNGSKKIKMLDDRKLDVMQMARIMREMGDWIAINHKELVF